MNELLINLIYEAIDHNEFDNRSNVNDAAEQILAKHKLVLDENKNLKELLKMIYEADALADWTRDCYHAEPSIAELLRTCYNGFIKETDNGKVNSGQFKF